MSRSERTLQTEEEILVAAEQEFLRYGFRKTTMEGLAAAAKVAKATLYAHFATKQIVFDRVCARRSEMMAAFAREAAAKEADPVDGVRASMTAKFSAIRAFVSSSSHAGELLEAALSREHAATAKAHDAYVEDIAAALSQGLNLDRPQAIELAELAEQAAEGVLRSAQSDVEFQRHLALLFGRLFA